MDTVTNTKADLSSLIDGELDQAQTQRVLANLSSDTELRKAWDDYHLLADAIRSEDLAVPLSDDFQARLSARLQLEPTILAPSHAPNLAATEPSQVGDERYLAPANGSRLTWSHSMAIMSVAATVMVAILMAPQIIPLLQNSSTSNPMAKVEASDSSLTNPVVLANNASASVNTARDAEFAPRLENQVEMLRDPRLDSYLMAHQKASPTLDNGARYIKRANVTSANLPEN